MNPIRLTLVTHYFSTHRGGIEQAAGHLASRLAQRGNFNIEWFASDCDSLPDANKHITLHPLRAWNWFEKIGIPWPVWTCAALKKLKISISNCDVVHLHDFIYFGNIAAFFFARWYHKPIVITQHIGDASMLTPSKALFLNLLNRTLGRFMLSRAKQVVCISDEVRHRFASHVHFTTAPLLWPNALDTSVFYPVALDQRIRLRQQLNVDESQPVFLFVGRFVERKGMALLHEMAQSMPQTQWWFAGWGQKNSPLHPTRWALPNIHVFENRSGESLADLYRAADLLVLPSHSEGFPLVIQEAMACGTSTLVSPETAMGAHAARPWMYTCSLTPLHSASSRWKVALTEIISNSAYPSRREPVAAFARQEWTWEHCVARYAQLFEQLTQHAVQ